MHIAFIPARRGSKALPFKNRSLFDFTADFIDVVPWFDKVIVSTDDEIIFKKTRSRGYELHYRTKALAGDVVSIKDVFRSVIRDKGIPPNAVIWLFYLPIVYKKRADFDNAQRIIEREDVKSLCSFIPAKTHPFSCWKYDKKRRKISQYLRNDVFRRQDMPPAWMHHHYLCCFRAGQLERLNSELIYAKTYPVFFSKKSAEGLIEIDTPEDYRIWKMDRRNRNRGL